MNFEVEISILLFCGCLCVVTQQSYFLAIFALFTYSILKYIVCLMYEQCTANHEEIE